MYHSIQFIRPEDIHSSKPSNEVDPYVKDTYNDWSLVPTTRPSVAPPVPKTKYVDIPGSNSQLDFSTSLTGYPIYQNRTGSWDFMIDLDKNDKPWAELYSEVMDWLQGKEMCCILEDDQEWFYKGRFYVEKLNSQDKYTTITINYNVYPYKKYAVLGADYDADWLWDPFDFVDGVIPDVTMRGIKVNWDEYIDYYILTHSHEEWYQIFGTEPVIPIIKIETEDPNDRVYIKFRNDSLNKPEVETGPLAAGAYTFRNIIFGGRCLETYQRGLRAPVYYPNTSILMGDIDHDGKVIAKDASLILTEIANISAGLPPSFTEDQMKAADMNLDGKLSSVDASLVLTIYANNEAGTTIIENGYYILDSAFNNTMSLKLKGHGTVSFLFIPGRL